LQRGTRVGFHRVEIGVMEQAHILLAGFLRRTWLVGLVAVVVCAAFAARAVAAFVEASYLVPNATGAPPPTRVQETHATHPLPDGRGFVERNMFCSTCASSAEPGPTDAFVPAAILIATSLGAVPLATVRVPGSEVQGSFAVGDAIPGVGTVAAIDWVSIDVIDERGRRGRLSLVATGSAKPERAPEAAATPWADRVRKIDDTTYEVERSLVRELVSGAARPGGTRVIPITGDGGKLAGLRIAGAGPDSLAAALGLRNSDVLRDVNGAHIESANTLLDLYSKLDQLNVVEIDGTRAGRPLTLTLRLR
jgi:hypothetical protein